MGLSHAHVADNQQKEECLNSVKLSEHFTFAYTETSTTLHCERAGGVESAGKPGREGYIQWEGEGLLMKF